MDKVTKIPCTCFEEAVPLAMEQAGAAAILRQHDRILLKPNLVNDSPPPITTPVDFVEAVVMYVQSVTDAPIVIAEGCGDNDLDTDEIFKRLGFVGMARRTGVELLDLNHAPTRESTVDGLKVFPTMILPEVAFTHCIMSLPVLKAHSLAVITGTLKNMMGFPPPAHYQGGGWKKASFHARMQTSIKDLNRHVTPHFTVMDASVGMAEFHLGGATCNPPLNTILAGADPVAIDREGCTMLGEDWQSVGHLRD